MAKDEPACGRKNRLPYPPWRSLPHPGRGGFGRSGCVHAADSSDPVWLTEFTFLNLYSFCPGVEYILGRTLRTVFSICSGSPRKLCWMNKWMWSRQALGGIIIILKCCLTGLLKNRWWPFRLCFWSMMVIVLWNTRPNCIVWHDIAKSVSKKDAYNLNRNHHTIRVFQIQNTDTVQYISQKKFQNYLIRRSLDGCSPMQHQETLVQILPSAFIKTGFCSFSLQTNAVTLTQSM